MTCQNPYKGQIQTVCQKPRPETKNIRFDITPPQKPPVSKTLMNNFKSFGLTEEEKRRLSHKHREQIVAFQNVDDELMNKYITRLISLLKHKDVERAHVKASDFGAFICLAALYSGRFPKETPITFEFHSFPLSLFPKKWVFDSQFGPDIDINFSPDISWQGQFQSFSEPPQHVRLPKKVQKELRAKLAA